MPTLQRSTSFFLFSFFAFATPLLAQPDKTAWEVLKQGLAEKNVDKHRQALTATGSMGLLPEAIELVEQGLKDMDPLIRQTAAAELGQMKSKPSIPALKAAMDDSDGQVAFAAAKALWDMGDKSGRGLIEDVLTGDEKTSEGVVSGAMRDAKRKMHDPRALAMMGLKEASGALLGPFNIGIIAAEQAFKDGSAGGRTLAIALLTDECDPQTVRLLDWSFSNDKSWAVKAAAAKGLGKCSTAESIPKLETALSDSHEAVKAMSAAAIIRLSQKSEQKQAGAE
ncbi:MAG TPA: HEAT repeat domain-containing protein [Bryobacteraceae bacterium]|nr:HEAT repeat domain-containing protein [Bryobacteraceae bacterium]